MLTDGLESCGLLLDYCVAFISCFTLIPLLLLSDVKLHFFKSLPTKKQTHLHRSCPEYEYIFSKVLILGALFL